MMFDSCKDITYQNGLNISRFSQLLNDNAQGYKYYWLESIIELSLVFDGDIPFDEIFNLMIFYAWYSVTYYHLRLGPAVKAKEENFLEHAVKVLNEKNPGLDEGEIQADRIKLAIMNSSEALHFDKMGLCNYVPHRLLTPFFKEPGLEEGLSYIKSDSRGRFSKYLSELDSDYNIFYIILDGRGLGKKIRINKIWKRFLADNYTIIKDWIQFNKVQYLQNRNPGVPDISRKVSPEIEDERKLENVRTLWKMYSKITERPLVDIYSKDCIQEKKLSIDHFIPRSYLSNDELWDLIPMDKSLNSSKSNRLPNWDDYYSEFSDKQFLLYETIFPKDQKRICDEFVKQFIKCKRDNLNSLASEKLFVGGHCEEEFKNMLKDTILPLYHSAELMGYEKWIKN